MAKRARHGMTAACCKASGYSAGSCVANPTITAAIEHTLYACHDTAIVASYRLQYVTLELPLFMPNAVNLSERKTLALRLTGKLAASLAAALWLAACAGGSETISSPQVGLSCVDDSSHCIQQRGKVLDGYMSDKSRAWVKQPASPAAYASGVRMFAVSKKRKELSCDELKHAKREADGASGSLRGPGGKGLTPAQISRGVMLAGDVSREIAREISRRC